MGLQMSMANCQQSNLILPTIDQLTKEVCLVAVFFIRFSKIMGFKESFLETTTKVVTRIKNDAPRIQVSEKVRRWE